MKIVLDSNIIFSILIKSDGKIAGLFHALVETNELYISDFTFNELNKHSNRLIKISKLSSEGLEKLKLSTLRHVSIIPSDILPDDVITKAYELTKDIDLDDLPFVAAALFINGHLWTGDKVLYAGLIKKDFQNIYNSKQIEILINK